MFATKAKGGDLTEGVMGNFQSFPQEGASRDCTLDLTPVQWDELCHQGAATSEAWKPGWGDAAAWREVEAEGVDEPSKGLWAYEMEKRRWYLKVHMAGGGL